MTQSSQSPSAPPPTASASAAGPASPPSVPAHLTRSPRQKVFAGVCGGLGRYCDIDPVIFRIVIGVLTATGGIGLIFYGFAWLLIPLDGEDETEARRLLSGRVDGTSLVAVLLALVGCGLFLSMLGDDGTLSFAAMLSIAVVGSAVWSQRRRVTQPDGGPLDPATAQAVAEAPPETKAPPTPDTPSWWRDPISKDGTTVRGGPVYLWGPEDAAGPVLSQRHLWHRTAAPGRLSRPPGPRGIGGTVCLLALLAGGLGTGLSWNGHPFGTSLQIGLVCALAIFGLGLAVSSFVGRTGIGTIFLAVVTAGLLAAASAVPKNITTGWERQHWSAASVSAVRDHYELGTGAGVLDLRRLTIPKGQTVSTSAEVGAGQLKVVVPDGVTVKVNAEAALGDIRLPREAPNDVDISPSHSAQRTLTPRAGADPAGTLVLHLEVGLGQVEVARAAA
ncbi:PspC domain-containing protein [Streptomyces sp. NPDC088116]|uniref:PspC domain-containing protein n=1 Tax=Streptomyces sp. NPDC088116 TaxID=3365825 RepID=UPI003811643E